MYKLIQKQKTGWLAMAFMLLPAMLHAQDANQIYVTDSGVSVRAGTNVCEIVGDKEYADLGDALAAAKNNQTIKLLQTINYQRNFQSDSYGIRIEGKSITFDLNGFNLNVEIDDGAALVVTGAGSEVKLAGKGELNVTSKGLGGAGVVAQYGGKATVTNAIGGGGAEAHNNSTVTVLGNASSTEGSFVGRGVWVSTNGAATIYGNVTGSRYGVYARSGATVTVHGNVIAKGDDIANGVDTNNATVTVYGDVTGDSYGIFDDSGSVIKVMGAVTGGMSGIHVNGGLVTVSGKVTGGRSYGATAHYGANVSLLGGATSDNFCGVRANTGSKMLVTGGVTGKDGGVEAGDNNTTITVSGDVTRVSARDGSKVTITGNIIDGGVHAVFGSNVTITGDVIGSGNDVGVEAVAAAVVKVIGNISGDYGVGLYAVEATVTVSGNVTGKSYGVGADGSNVSVAGDVSGRDGVKVFSRQSTAKSTIMIGGDVMSIPVGDTRCTGVEASGKAEITIDGKIKVPDEASFISFWKESSITVGYGNFFDLTPADYQSKSSKSGYLEYTDGQNYVWMKGDITGTDNIQQPSSTLKASTKNGRLHVSGLTVGDLWTVCNLSGAIVYQNRATAEDANINLPTKGIYIIISAGQSVKAWNF